ncbi:MAG: hypothetical protein GAK28_01577 [Luteibacter sp.]|nr:MAG: hypothetical protein GAK28_01577 [Luteibacter sp.]
MPPCERYGQAVDGAPYPAVKFPLQPFAMEKSSRIAGFATVVVKNLRVGAFLEGCR